MALQGFLFAASPTGHGSYTFTRSSSAYEVDRDGILQLRSTDQLRIEHIDRDNDGLPESPAFLVERASTNLLTRAAEFDNSTWVLNLATVVANHGAAADGSTTADLLVPSSHVNIHYIQQQAAVTASTDHAFSVYASPAGYNYITMRLINSTGGTAFSQGTFELISSGAVAETTQAGGGTSNYGYIERLRTGTYRCVFVGAVSTSTGVFARVYVESSSEQNGASWGGGGSSAGLGVRLWGAQVEESQNFATSLILSSANSTSRAEGGLFFPFTHTQQQMTVYAHFRERGNALDVGHIVLIGDSGVTSPSFEVFAANITKEGYSAAYWHDPQYTIAEMSSSELPSVGEDVELRAVLDFNGDQTGGVLLGQSRDGAAEVTVSSTGTLTEPHQLAVGSSWNEEKIWLGTRSSEVGVNPIYEVKVAAGAQTMAYMRSLDPALALASYSIPVAVGSPRTDVQEIGDRSRTFDGSLRETIRNRVDSLTFDTTPLLSTDANDVYTAIESSTQPQTAYGSLIQTSTGQYPDVFSRVAARSYVQSGGDTRQVLSIVLEESS